VSLYANDKSCKKAYEKTMKWLHQIKSNTSLDWNRLIDFGYVIPCDKKTLIHCNDDSKTISTSVSEGHPNDSLADNHNICPSLIPVNRIVYTAKHMITEGVKGDGIDIYFIMIVTPVVGLLLGCLDHSDNIQDIHDTIKAVREAIDRVIPIMVQNMNTPLQVTVARGLSLNHNDCVMLV
jgi:hypothetical protein